MLDPPDAIPQIPSFVVHVFKYKGEDRDYWGEVTSLFANDKHQLTMLVHLFAPDGEERQWRRFIVEQVEVE